MVRMGISPREILDSYGIDVSSIPESRYYINEETGMLVVFDRSRIVFEGDVKPKEVVYGSFSDMHFHYFPRIGGQE
jgi:hypothetical protein